jgi:hypothetical protein
MKKVKNTFNLTFVVLVLLLNFDYFLSWKYVKSDFIGLALELYPSKPDVSSISYQVLYKNIVAKKEETK